MVTEKIERLLELGHNDPESEIQRQILIDTVFATMGLEGIHLRRELVATVAEEHFARTPEALVKTASNIIQLYRRIEEFDPTNYETLFDVFKVLAEGKDDMIIDFRTEEANPFRNDLPETDILTENEVPRLMLNLFEYTGLSHESPVMRAIMAQYIFISQLCPPASMRMILQNFYVSWSKYWMRRCVISIFR